VPVKLPTYEYLNKCFSYDPTTGVLTRKTRPREHFKSVASWKITNAQFAGKTVTTLDGKGYICVSLDQRTYRAHRVIWAMTIGEWPEKELDHINGVTDDNSLGNLREASRSQNLRNTKKPRKNTSGAKGVTWDKSRTRWIARINANGKAHHLGRFKTFEEAERVARFARPNLHKGFANHG
jgi:HNH endonuclease/AP2 domain